jgi:hypothetical protein
MTVQTLTAKKQVKQKGQVRKIHRFTGLQKTWETTEATTTTPKVVSAVVHREVRQLNWKWAVCRREDPRLTLFVGTQFNES